MQLIKTYANLVQVSIFGKAFHNTLKIERVRFSKKEIKQYLLSEQYLSKPNTTQVCCNSFFLKLVYIPFFKMFRILL